MASRVHMAVSLTLTALGLAPGAAHLMEMPVKLGYAPAFYAEVTSTLYAWYGIAGGMVQVAAALTVVALAFRLRRSRAAGLAAASAAALVISLALWAAVVAPVNSAWADVSRADLAEFAAAYGHLRSRWEFGHLAAFIAWLTGWLGLVAVATGEPGAAARGTV
ncbi:MAG: hypothetical protein IT518_29420 [Burkholderiales bacterium]|nr:hypothetical protein [Burkholderiales bacterium]